MIDKAFKSDWMASGTVMSCSQGRLLIGWGKRKWHQSQPSIRGQTAFYFPDFFLSDKTPWFEHEHTQEITLEDLLQYLSQDAFEGSRILHWNNPYQNLFNATFAELQLKFAANEIDKAVPFVFESSSTQMNSDKLIYSIKSCLMYAQNYPAFVYGFWDEKQGILGVTPELLFRFEKGNTLETIAVAGTSGLRDNMEELLNDPKEGHEHELVVQGIRESLMQFGQVAIGERNLLRLPKVTHLATPISVHLEEAPDFEKTVRALHPTPALGASPRKQGMLWLADYQRKIDRRRFGAPAGYVNSKTNEACCYVAIRNAQWDTDAICIGAGCGVVPASQQDLEWAEINLKLQAIKEILTL